MSMSMARSRDADDERGLITHKYGLRAHVRVSDSGDTEAKDAAHEVWAQMPSVDVHPEAAEATTNININMNMNIMQVQDITDWGAEDCVAVAWINGVAVGAGRLRCTKGNAALESVYVLPKYRSEGIGRTIVKSLLSYLGSNYNLPGATYVYSPGVSLGFYSLLGFEVQGGKLPSGDRLMIFRVPECTASPGEGCIGLHHTSMRVMDIERSLAFYGCLGFFVTDKFHTAGGSRACFIEGLGVRLELVECPISSNSNSNSSGYGSNGGVLGFDRLVFDVTKACIDLDGYIEHLRRKNGGFLMVRGPSATQVVGKYVVSVATIEDADGLPIEFIRRETIVPSSLRTRVKW